MLQFQMSIFYAQRLSLKIKNHLWSSWRLALTVLYWRRNSRYLLQILCWSRTFDRPQSSELFFFNILQINKANSVKTNYLNMWNKQSISISEWANNLINNNNKSGMYFWSNLKTYHETQLIFCEVLWIIGCKIPEKWNKTI